MLTSGIRVTAASTLVVVGMVGVTSAQASGGAYEVKAPATDSSRADQENELTKREEIERLRNAKAIPNDDPLLIEGELPNRERVSIHVMGDPKLFDDMTPAEFADVLEDELERDGKQ